MLSEITSLTVASINGSTKIDTYDVSINANKSTVSGSVVFPDTPGDYLTMSVITETGKTSVSFSSDNTTEVLALVDKLTTKLIEIKIELGL